MLFKKEYNSTLDLGDKEASGRVILGLFMRTVKEALELKYDVRLFVDHEYRLLSKKTYACDEAVTAKM